MHKIRSCTCTCQWNIMKGPGNKRCLVQWHFWNVLVCLLELNTHYRTATEYKSLYHKLHFSHNENPLKMINRIIWLFCMWSLLKHKDEVNSKRSFSTWYKFLLRMRRIKSLDSWSSSSGAVSIVLIIVSSSWIRRRKERTVCYTFGL